MPRSRCGAAKQWRFSFRNRIDRHERSDRAEPVALCPRRYTEQRQDRAVQRAHRQPAEGRQLSGRHRRTQSGRHPDAGGQPRQPDRSTRHLFAARPQPRRSDHPRHRARPAGQRGAARSAAVRRRRHQSAAGAAPGARAQAGRLPAVARAQYDRHCPPPRHRDRSRQVVARTRRAGGHLDRRAQRRYRGTDAAHGRDGRELLRLVRQYLAAADDVRAARRPTRGRQNHPRRGRHGDAAGHAHRQSRRRAAASHRRPRDPALRSVHHVPGRVRLGEAADGSDRGRI